MPHTLYTIGYSSFLNPDDFISALKKNNVNALVDVRGFPNLASFEHYKGENLKKLLNANGIHYLSFANEFGVRPKEDRYYTDDIVNFGKIAASESFKSGCERIFKGLEKYDICLMCAEKNPAVCHRGVFLTHLLEKLQPGLDIRHILPDRIITQRDIDDDLKKRYALLDGSLEICYKLHGRSIAWRRKARNSED